VLFSGIPETTPGAEIDISAIIERIRWASDRFDLQEVTFDRSGGFKAAANPLLRLRDSASSNFLEGSVATMPVASVSEIV
jgi:hypothetical protein